MRGPASQRRCARESDEDLVAIDELARRHRASPSAIRAAIAAGQLESFGYGDDVRVRRRSFRAWHVGRLRGSSVIVDDVD